jgi:hypothetical protein
MPIVQIVSNVAKYKNGTDFYATHKIPVSVCGGYEHSTTSYTVKAPYSYIQVQDTTQRGISVARNSTTEKIPDDLVATKCSDIKCMILPNEPAYEHLMFESGDGLRWQVCQVSIDPVAEGADFLLYVYNAFIFKKGSFASQTCSVNQMTYPNLAGKFYQMYMYVLLDALLVPLINYKLECGCSFIYFKKNKYAIYVHV